MRPARAARLKADGLRIVSPNGDATLHPPLVTAAEINEPFDVVLLTVKAYSLAAAMDDFAPAVGPETIILPVLNGMRHMDVLAARFGEKSVAGCACRIAASIDNDGRIVHGSRFSDIVYGEMDGSASERMHRLDAFMQDANFDARLSTAIAREMWEKWILLATLGGVNALMRGSIGDIEAAAGGRDFMVRFLGEAVAIVRAVGVPPSDAFLTSATAMLTTKGSPLTSSMYRDLQAGNAVEADQIIGDLLARARKAGLDTPLLAAAYTNLMVYQNRITAPR